MARNYPLNKRRYFALTGSSARKLKHSSTNLLAGRAFTYNLFPLTNTELGSKFNLDEVLHYGALPQVLNFKDIEDKKSYLRSYVQTYLKQEIQGEGIIRNLPAFHKFLPLAANENGNVLVWSNFAQDVGVDAKTIKAHFQILEDTLIGSMLPAYHRSIRKQQKTSPKFYFFDTGVQRTLANQLNLPLLPQTAAYGRAFEHAMILELMRANDYLKRDYQFSYIGTHNSEIDLVIERPGKSTLFVEFKSSASVRTNELRTLASIIGSEQDCEAICVCRETRPRRHEEIIITPWQQMLEVCDLV